MTMYCRVSDVCFFLPLLPALRSARYLDASSLFSLYHWESGLVPPKPGHLIQILKIIWICFLLIFDICFFCRGLLIHRIVIWLWRKFIKLASGMLINSPIVFTFTRQRWCSTIFSSNLALLVWKSNIRIISHPPTSSATPVINGLGATG